MSLPSLSCTGFMVWFNSSQLGKKILALLVSSHSTGFFHQLFKCHSQRSGIFNCHPHSQFSTGCSRSPAFCPLLLSSGWIERAECPLIQWLRASLWNDKLDYMFLQEVMKLFNQEICSEAERSRKIFTFKFNLNGS